MVMLVSGAIDGTTQAPLILKRFMEGKFTIKRSFEV